jgi:uncharacterized membrane protein YkvA (DUF1232 family)
MLESVPKIIAIFSKKQAKKEFLRRQKLFRKEDGEKILDQKEKLFNFFQNRSSFRKQIEDFKDLFSLLQDFYEGNYNDVTLLTIASIGGSFNYMLRPIVLKVVAPNPFTEYLQDMAFSAVFLKFVKEDLEKYREWKKLEPVEV